MIYYEVAIV